MSRFTPIDKAIIHWLFIALAFFMGCLVGVKL